MALSGVQSDGEAGMSEWEWAVAAEEGEAGGAASLNSVSVSSSPGCNRRVGDWATPL